MLKHVMLAGALASFAADAALAQSSDDGQPIGQITVLGRRAQGLTLNTQSSTGSRLDLTPLQTPASIQILTGELIRERGDRSILDAVSRATGITTLAAPGNGNSSLSARGFTGVNSVMQLFDGVQLFVGSGTVTFPFDPWTAERIEVLGGPASVLYGTGAIGGAVNVVPRKPDAMKSGGEARFTTGTRQTFREAVDFNGAIGDATTVRLDVSRNDSNGWVDRGNSSSTALSASVGFRFSDTLSLTLSEDYGDQHPARYFGTPLIAGHLDRSVAERNFNVQDATMQFQDSFTRAALEWTPSDRFKLRNTLYYLTTDRHYRDVESYSYAPATRLVTRSNYIELFHHENQVGDHGDATVKLDAVGLPVQVVAGFDVNTIDFQHVNNSPYGGTSTVDPYALVPGSFVNLAETVPKFKSSTQQASLYAEARVGFTPDLSLVGGVRRDSYDVTRTDLIASTRASRSYDTVSGRVGAVYEPIRNLSLYAQYSAATDPVSSLITLSPAQQLFDLTTGEQWEVGIKQALPNPRIDWSFAAYRIVKNNLLVPDPVTPSIQRQVGQQSSHGLEASVAIVLAQGLRVEANGTVLVAKYDDFTETVGGRIVSRSGNVPTNVPRRAGNLSATLDLPGAWQMRAGLRYVGRRYVDTANVVTVPSYTVVDAGVRWSPTPSLSIDLALFNVGDTIYAATPSNSGQQWILGRPRAAELSASIRF